MLPEVDSYEEKLLKLREIKLEQRRLELKRDQGLIFYTPHAGQDAFHLHGDRHYRMVRCGNRWGKSTAGCAEDLAWMLGERMWYKRAFTIYNADGSLYRHHPGGENHPAVRVGIPQRPVKGLVICQDWGKVREVWTESSGARPGKIFLLCPKGRITTARKNHAGVIDYLTFDTRSTLQFETVESYKKNPQSSESADYDFIHVDEPCPEGMFQANARGLVDRHGSCWFTVTPRIEFWINDLFFPPVGVVPKFGPDKLWSASGKMNDNPHNSAEAIQDFLSLLSPDEAECRLNGIPLELSGLVYKSFEPSRHVFNEVPQGWKSLNEPPLDYILEVSIDTHARTPMAVLFTAIGPDNKYYIFQELFIKCSVAELAEQILLMTRNYTVARVKCEPGAWINDPVTQSSIAEELCNNGLFVEKASKAKTHGILKMQALFSAKPTRIFVACNLQRFLFEINRYCYDKENKPMDKDDHLMECMYRTFVNDPEWFDPQVVSRPIEDEEIGASLAL